MSITSRGHKVEIEMSHLDDPANFSGAIDFIKFEIINSKSQTKYQIIKINYPNEKMLTT